MKTESDDPAIRALRANETATLIRLLDSGKNISKHFHFGRTLLHIAAEEGSLECARLLLRAGANVNQQDVDGLVPMGRVRSDEMLDLLLEHGADPNMGDQCNLKPPHWIDEPGLKARLESLERDG